MAQNTKLGQWGGETLKQQLQTEWPGGVVTEPVLV